MKGQIIKEARDFTKEQVIALRQSNYNMGASSEELAQRDIIIEELKKIEEQENVKIIMAIESGSRAWGFESPDSDYDVRFIYARRPEDYLKFEGIRDVIEWKLDDVLDINGWDIKKALQLLHKSNPTVFEWCASPIVYYDSDEFDKLKEILPQYFSQKNRYIIIGIWLKQIIVNT